MWMIIVACILLFFVLLFSANIRVIVRADADNTYVRIRYLFLSIDPLKERKPKKQKKKKPKKEPPQQVEARSAKSKLDDFKKKVDDFMPLIESLSTATKKILRGVRVRSFVLYLKVGKEDAAETAIEYGRLCALVYGAYAAINNFLTIPRPSITLESDFKNECFEWRFSALIKARLFLFVRVGTGLLWGLVKSKMNEQKGGAVNGRNPGKRDHEHNPHKNQRND